MFGNEHSNVPVISGFQLYSADCFVYLEVKSYVCCCDVVECLEIKNIRFCISVDAVSTPSRGNINVTLASRLRLPRMGL